MAPPDELIQPVPDEQAVIEAYKRFAELLKNSQQLIIFAEAHCYDVTPPTCLLVPTNDLEIQVDPREEVIISHQDQIKTTGTLFGLVENILTSSYGELSKLAIRMNEGVISEIQGKVKSDGKWAPRIHSLMDVKFPSDPYSPPMKLKQIKIGLNGRSGDITYKFALNGKEFEIKTKQAADEAALPENNPRGFLLLDNQVLQADGNFIHPDLRDLNFQNNQQLLETYYGMAQINNDRKFQTHTSYGTMLEAELNALIGGNWRPVQWGWDYKKNIQYIYQVETGIKELPVLLGQKQTKLLTGTDIAGQKKEYARIRGSY